MKTECSICKQKRKIIYQGKGSHYCEPCWSVVNAPYDKLLRHGRKYSKENN